MFIRTHIPFLLSIVHCRSLFSVYNFPSSICCEHAYTMTKSLISHPRRGCYPVQHYLIVTSLHQTKECYAKLRCLENRRETFINQFAKGECTATLARKWGERRAYFVKEAWMRHSTSDLKLICTSTRHIVNHKDIEVVPLAATYHYL